MANGWKPKTFSTPLKIQFTFNLLGNIRYTFVHSEATVSLNVSSSTSERSFWQSSEQGQVVGIPKKIGPNIYQYLCDVVKEIRPVIHPEDEAQPLADFNVLDQSGAVRPQAEPNNPTTQIEGIPWVVDRKYRDSAYSVLASMYSQLRPDRHLQLKTSEVTAGMRNFTDLDIEYDHRSRKNGAFKSMDQLVDKRLVNKNKSGGEWRVEYILSISCPCTLHTEHILSLYNLLYIYIFFTFVQVGTEGTTTVWRVTVFVCAIICFTLSLAPLRTPPMHLSDPGVSSFHILLFYVLHRMC